MSSILNLFSTCVLKNPNNLAVIFQDSHLTYQELDVKSSQLAAYLKKRNIQSNDLVGLYLDRNMDIIISILALFKLNCAFVPLDPDFPLERLNFIIKNSNIQKVITNKEINACIAKCDWITLSNLEKETPIPDDYSTKNTSLAYVIYTSGSTGCPKGVMIKHHSLFNLITAFQKTLSISQSDNILSLTTYCFDISLLELLLPICYGATLVIASRRMLIDMKQLSVYIAEQNITVMQATPIVWEMLLNFGWTNQTKLTILCGGEALSTQLLTKFLTVSNGIWNLYGPTETTIWSSVAHLTSTKNIHIGHPIQNTFFYILDKNKKEVRNGEIGELYIGGEGVSTGYLNRDDLTALSFIKNPFGNGLLYKTGDLVKKDSKGNYIFVGRLDTQIKLNGYRIELSEIEYHLNQLPTIKNSVIVYSKLLKKIIAFVISSNQVKKDKINEYLLRFLPTYMQIQELFYVASFPLTPNKKVDRNELIKIAEQSLLNNKKEHRIAKHSFPLFNLQNEMLQNSLFFPEEKNFYEKVILKHNRALSLDKIKYAFTLMTNELDILKTSFSFLKKEQFLSEPQNHFEYRILTQNQSITPIIKNWIKDKTPFNFNMCPFYALILHSTQKTTFVFYYHHALMDGFSFNLFWHLFCSIYYQKGIIDFSKYNKLEEAIQSIQKRKLNQDIIFFKKQPKATIFLTEKLCTKNGHFFKNGATKQIIFSLSLAETKRLKKISQQYNITLACLIQFCWMHIIRIFLNSNVISYALASSGRMFLSQETKYALGNLLHIFPVVINLNEHNDIHKISSLLMQHIRHSLIAYDELDTLTKNIDHALIINQYPFSYNHFNKKERITEKHIENNNLKLNITFNISDKIDIKFNFKQSIDRQALLKIAKKYVSFLKKGDIHESILD